MASLEDYLENNYSKRKRRRREHNPDTVDVGEEEHVDISVPDDAVRIEHAPVKGAWKSIETKELVEVQPQLMDDGSFAGLQTKEQIEKSKESKRRKFEVDRATARSSRGTETVYRDLEGRRVDRTELRSKAQLKLEREQRVREAGRSEGDKAAEKRQQAKLKKLHTEKLNRYEDDPEANRELKDKVSVNDPALMFDKTTRQTFKRAQKSQHVSATGRKLYKGSASCPQNRFGIKPGYRWDGVDRTNGFEQRWFERQADIKERRTLEEQ